MAIELRDYQVKAIELIRELYQTKTKKVLLHLPTGSGKTLIFTYIAKANQDKGKTCFVVTRGKELVYNAYHRMVKDGLDCGIIMAGNAVDYSKSIQVISIDSLRNRWDSLEYEPDLLIVDEAHYTGAKSWIDLAERFPDAYYLGVTATPYQKKSILHIATDIVAPITHQELVDQKYLVPSKVYAPTEVDLKGVKITDNDYNNTDLYRAVDKKHVYADVIKYYLKVTDKAPAFCFCVNVEHSMQMCRAFEAVGIRAIHADADSSRKHREQAMLGVANGNIDVITNCNIFSTGVDVPNVRAILMARPTQSRVLFGQQAGRGTRPFPGKDFFWLMDHANNVRTHGFIETHVPGNLTGQPKSSVKGAPPVKTCYQCFAVVAAHAKTCPRCNQEFPVKKEGIKTAAEIALEEIDKKNFKPIDNQEITQYFEYYKKLGFSKHYSPWWPYYKVREKYGEQAAKQFAARIARRKNTHGIE